MTNLIFDFNHLAYRCFCVNDTLITSSGEKTGVLFGILRSLRSLCDKFKPDFVVFCRDLNKSFRKDILESYKGSRGKNQSQEVKEDYYNQINLTIEVIQTLGVPVVGYSNLEADDLCALCSRKIFSGESDYNIIISGDKDLLQLVNQNTDYYYPFYEKLISLSGAQFEGNFNSTEFPKFWALNKKIHPESFVLKSEKSPNKIPFDRWLLYRSLVGDSSDELSGIKGIGGTTAQKIVAECSSITEVIEKKESMSFLNKRQKESITKEELQLQHNLINLDLICKYPGIDDVIIDMKNQFKLPSRNVDLFNNFLTKYQFFSIQIELNQFLKNIPSNSFLFETQN